MTALLPPCNRTLLRTAMHFSEIRMRPGRERAAVHRRLDHPDDDHHWLWRWFAAPPDTARDFVFRRHSPPGRAGTSAQSAGLDEAPLFYVVSARPPAAELDGWTARSRPYDPQLEAGAVLDFELRANPTVRHAPLRHEPRPEEAPRHARRHDVVMDAKKKWAASHAPGRSWKDIPAGERPSMAEVLEPAARAWIERRGERNGFAVDAASLRVDAYRQHELPPSRQAGRGAKPRAFSTIDFAGRLTVTDPAALRGALLGGVGSAKAFGCGLLLVRRAG